MGGDTHEIFDLLSEFCSAGQLKNLVKAYRPAVKDFPISATRDELLRSVKKLHGTHHIPLRALEDLLERAEENGRQHIFLYIPATESGRSRLNDFNIVQAVLLDQKTRAEAGLPKFQIHPQGVAVADLRQEHRDGTEYSFWVYKLYAGSERWIKTSSEVTGNEKTVHYTLNYRREVFIIKWHSFGLLEVRIPTGNSRTRLVECRDAILRKLRRITATSASPEDDAIDVLGEAMDAERPAKLLAESQSTESDGVKMLRLPLQKLDTDARSPDIKWIYVNDSLLTYHGVKLRIHADDEQENAFCRAEVREKFKDVRDCEEVRAIVHLADSDSQEKLSVEFGTSFKNELRIGPQTTPEAVEFIVRRVWERASDDVLPPSPVDALAQTENDGPKLNLAGLDSLAHRYPYLLNAFKGLQKWIDENPTVDFLDPDRLRKQATAGVPPEDFAIALAALVEEGVLVRRFRVRPAPGRQFIPQQFESFDQIKNGDLKDSKGDPVNLDEATIVPVFGGGRR